MPFGLSLACVKADAATLFSALDDFGLLKILLALDATDFEVFSFFAMVINSASKTSEN